MHQHHFVNTSTYGPFFLDKSWRKAQKFHFFFFNTLYILNNALFFQTFIPSLDYSFHNESYNDTQEALFYRNSFFRKLTFKCFIQLF